MSRCSPVRGMDYLYSGRPPSYQVPAPSSGAVNSLFAQSNYAGFTETQPDGTVFTYGALPVGGPAPLLSIQNPAGALWSLTYDSSNRVSSVTDPFSD